MSMSRELIGDFLLSPDWTDAEKWVIRWQAGVLGDFQQALAEAMGRADDGNLGKLATAFPVQADGFVAWNRGDLGQRLRKAGLEI